MAGRLREIKRRIGSVRSTQKITRAMELIASSRIIKAQQRVQAARPYAEQIRTLMQAVGRTGSIDHPLLRGRAEIRSIGTIVLTSDRGLAGAYNSNVLRAAERDIAEHGKQARVFPVGKKGQSYFRFRGYDFEHSWTGVSDQPRATDARDIARTVLSAFEGGDVDEVRLGYTRFESPLTQRPVVIQLLPVAREELEGADEGGVGAQYEFEPSPEELLGFLLPRYVEASIYQALLEAAASEHAARRRAMKAATDNAEELIEDLTRVYNQERQAEITTEIMEVVGGAEALTAPKELEARWGG